jgi:hypothetical protein
MRSSSSPNTSNPGHKGLIRRRLRAPFAFGPDGPRPACDPRPLSAALIAAYRATTYGVDGRPDWTLRVDAPCPALSARLAAAGLTEAVCLTGWNRRGWRTAAVTNVNAQMLLVARIRAMGLVAHPGWGRADAGDWPPERHVLVPGLSRHDGRALARDFGQRAVLWFPAGGVATILPVIGPQGA